MYPTSNPGDNGKSSSGGVGLTRLAGSILSYRPHIFQQPGGCLPGATPFIKEGLECGEKAVHTIDPRRRDEHMQRLALAGIDLTAVEKNDQLELRDWSNTHLSGGQFDQRKTLALFERVVRDANEKGFPLIRLVTQMECALETDVDLNVLLESEARANDVWLRQAGPVNPVF